jgi:hypothetical protein
MQAQPEGVLLRVLSQTTRVRTIRTERLGAEGCGPPPYKRGPGRATMEFQGLTYAGRGRAAGGRSHRPGRA